MVMVMYLMWGSITRGLPTMIILAVYYTLADIVLLWQCLAYGDGNLI